MREQKVTGKNKKGETYEGIVNLPESVEEYFEFVVAEELVKEKEVPADAVLRAICDYEMRRQRQTLRPTRQATGVKKFERAISAAIKSNKISSSDVEDILAKLGLA